MKILMSLVLSAVLTSATADEWISPLWRMAPYVPPHALDNGGDPGKPLFLTPYLEKGEIQEAQKLSRTGSLIPVEGYSGLLTVNKTIDSNIFFWFFPAQVNPETAPVSLWLNGGPGVSSMFGLFAENGPVLVDEEGDVLKRNITWNSPYSMIFIDNPVGTGFSFTGSESGYVNNEEEMARDLYSCLIQFFEIFTQFQKNDFYVTGESYAGKYIPAISYKIHMENPSAKTKINLKGLAIGNGLSDPESMMPVYGPYLFHVGLLDENQRDKATMKGTMMQSFIRSGMYLPALGIYTTLLDDIEKEAGVHQFYNYVITNNPKEYGYYGKFLEKPEARFALHVGNLTYNDGKKVSRHLRDDFMMSVKPWLTTLMESYKVLLYNGQLDIIVANPLTEAMINTIDWSGKEEYKTTKKILWKVDPSDSEVAGYVRRVKNFYQIVVRSSGHIVPYDQPRSALDMIRRFIEDKGFEE